VNARGLRSSCPSAGEMMCTAQKALQGHGGGPLTSPSRVSMMCSAQRWPGGRVLTSPSRVSMILVGLRLRCTMGGEQECSDARVSDRFTMMRTLCTRFSTGSAEAHNNTHTHEQRGEGQGGCIRG